MAVQERVRVPQFTPPEEVWVRCAETRSLHSGESGCIIATVDGDELVIVPSGDVEDGSVSGVKIGTSPTEETHLLIHFAHGDRLLVADDLVRKRNGRSL